MQNRLQGSSVDEKRRSSRIARSIPITIRGVDLLGQPFEERAATLTISLHGCKYASKHHLPKNTWITLEVRPSSPEDGRRCLRARVAWIQRPRTLRELFLIGVELESAENVWGVPAAPEDWLTPRAPSTAWMRPLGGAGHGTAESAEHESRAEEVAVKFPRERIEMELHPSSRDSGEVTSATAARQEHAAVAEPSPLLRELNAQLQSQSEHAVSGLIERASEQMQQLAEDLARERQNSMDLALSEMRQEVQRERSALSEAIQEQLREAHQSYRARMEGELREAMQQARDGSAELERRIAELRSRLDSAAEQAGLQQFLAEAEAAQASCRQGQRAADTAAEEAPEAPWRERLESDVVLARNQWDELLQSSIDAAAQRLVARLGEITHNAALETEQRLSARLSEVGQPLLQAASEARDTLAYVQSSLQQETGRARTSLADMEAAANRISEYSAQLQAASQDTFNELHRRLEGALTAKVAELNRRGEGLAGEMAERLSPMLESAGQQFVTRSLGDMESKLSQYADNVKQALRQLDARQEQAEDMLRVHRERLRQASEQNLRETESATTGASERLRRDFEEAQAQALAKWEEELGARGTRAADAAFDGMVKTSELYLQQAKCNLEAVLQDSASKAEQRLNELTAQSASRFAADLEQQAASRMDLHREHLAASSGEALGGARSALEEAAAAAASRFGEVLHGISQRGMEELGSESQRVLDQRTAQLQASFEDLRGNFEGDAARATEKFRDQLGKQIEGSLAEAQKSLAAQLAATVAASRDQHEAYLLEWQASLRSVSGESLEQYQTRLRALCDAWMVSSSEKLSEYGRAAIDSLACQAEQSMRRACSQVLENVAEALGDRARPSSGLADGERSSFSAAAGSAENHPSA